MADITDNDLEKWFNDVYLADRGARDQWDFLANNENARARMKDQLIAQERQRRIDQEALYESFLGMADRARYDGATVSDETNREISDFLVQKDEYLTKYPADKQAVDSQINRWLNNETNNENNEDTLRYGNDLFLIDDAFRNAYRDAELVPVTVIPAPVRGNDNSNQGEVVVVPPVVTRDENMPPVNTSEPTPKPERAFVSIDGMTSDEWQQIFTGDGTRFLTDLNMRQGMDVTILNHMGKLPDNFSDLDNDKKADVVKEAKEKLNPEERATFHDQDRQLQKEILEVYPPKRLVDTDKFLAEAEQHAEDDALKQHISNSRQIIMETMTDKIDAYAKGEIIVDQTNIADVYDGANQMFDYVEEKTDNDTVKQNIAVSREKLEKEIKIYDETNGFTDLTPEDAAEINKTYDRLTKRIEKNPNVPEEFGNLWNNIEFSDDSQREELISLFNEAALKQAARNTAVKHKGAKDDELDAALGAELQQVYTEQFGAMLINNEMLKHSFDKTYTAEQAEIDVRNSVVGLTQGQKIQVDNKAMVGNFALYTNNNMGYLNRLGTKIGKTAPVVRKMYDAVKKFDDTCIKRFNPLYGKTQSYLRAVGYNMARQGVNQVVRYSSSLIPGGNIVYGTYVAAQATIRLSAKYSQLKKEAKKNNQPFSGLKFLRNNIGEIASSAALTAAAYIPGGSMALGMGSAAVAMGTSFIKTYKAAREKGNGFWKSVGKSFGSVGASASTAVVSSLLLGEAIEMTGADSWAAEHFSQNVPADQYDPNDSHYHKEVVTDPNKIEEINQMSLQERADNGYQLIGAQKGEDGAFLIQEGKESFETRDYTQEELDFAKHRMEKVLDNDDTHTGGTRYSEHLGHDWTDKSYAENDAAYDNAIKSLDKLAETHKDMNSYVDGEFVSNSDMLLYKLYQANILAPNPDAIADNGQPIGEVLSYTDADGNVTNYQDVYHKLLEGKELTEADAKVIQIVEDHVGGQYENGVNDMGKIKDFDSLGNGGNPDSYNKDADVGYERNIHIGEEEVYGKYEQTTFDPRTGLPMFGMVYDTQEKAPQQALAERIGANGKTKQAIQESQNRLKHKKEQNQNLQDVKDEKGLQHESAPTENKEKAPAGNQQQPHIVIPRGRLD